MVRVLITGATGLLGGYLEAEVKRRGQVAIAYGGPRRETNGIDLGDQAAVLTLFERERPHVVIHSAAMAAMSDCIADPEAAKRINVDGTRNIASACTKHGVRLVHVSSDLIFDGESAPYKEEAEPTPLSIYGRTKAEAERAALTDPTAAVVRVALLFGPTLTERASFFDLTARRFEKGESMTLFEDEWRTPISLRAAAEGLLSIAEGAYRGTLNLGGPERMSRFEMGMRLARVLKIEPKVQAVSRTSLGGEPRPKDVSLDSTKFHRLFGSIATRSFEEECARMPFKT